MSGGVFTSSIEMVSPTGCEPEAEVLDPVEALGDEHLRVVRRDLLHDRRDRGGALSDDVVHIPETDRQRLVEEQPAGGRHELFGLLDHQACRRGGLPAGGTRSRRRRVRSRILA